MTQSDLKHIFTRILRDQYTGVVGFKNYIYSACILYFHALMWVAVLYTTTSTSLSRVWKDKSMHCIWVLSTLCLHENITTLSELSYSNLQRGKDRAHSDI